MSLEVDCEVEAKDSSGNAIYGLRYYCAKGYGKSIKWIPSNMRSVAKLAIHRLKMLSKPARQIALIREQGEFEFYNKLGVNSNETSFCKRFYNIINLENKDVFNLYSKEILSRIENENISAKELWKEIIKYEKIPDAWSSFNKTTKLSNCLLLLNKDQLHIKKGTDLFKASPATKELFQADFKARTGVGKDNALNFFQRHKSLQPEGMKEIFRSHQPRHLLNTLVQRSMLSDIEIAFWSGRRNVEQNIVYDNRSAEELREDERKVLYADEMISDLSGKLEIIAMIKAHLKSLNRTCEKLSNCLLLLNKDQLHIKKGTDLFKASPATKELFQADFKARTGVGKDNALNFFQRHKSLQPEGMKEIFRSHQPRHLLNTLVQRSMLSDIEIAFWSGRRNVEQNIVYDNRSAEELREDERKVLYADEMISDLSGKLEIIAMIKAHLKSLNRTCELYHNEIDLQSQSIFKKEIEGINKNINHIINYYTREDGNE
ncbi:hypothetical protein [Yersinia enterocolitica]|uniref:hypothetical protein n=1 Tax=Yersinia enterocolitica TaxID=630 RepID=UPI0002E905A1|nr:hypothetical protein [Yersinia enterocolitica]